MKRRRLTDRDLTEVASIVHAIKVIEHGRRVDMLGLAIRAMLDLKMLDYPTLPVSKPVKVKVVR